MNGKHERALDACPVNSYSSICLSLDSGGRRDILWFMSSSSSIVSYRTGSSSAPHAAPEFASSTWSGFSNITAPGLISMSLDSYPLHINVVHVDVLVHNCAVVIVWTADLLVDPYFDLRRDIRVLMKQIIFMITYVRDPSHRRVFTNLRLTLLVASIPVGAWKVILT